MTEYCPQETGTRACIGDGVVHVVSAAETAHYGSDPAGTTLHELRPGARPTTALRLLRSLLLQAGLDAAAAGSEAWNPLASCAPRVRRVLVKPNWVSHANKSNAGVECLVTHGDVLAAVLEYVALLEPESVVVGDAPIQEADFGRLREIVRASRLEERFRPLFPRFEIVDFRKGWLPGGRVTSSVVATSRTDEDYVLFDMGQESVLDPITEPSTAFRVTMYDPRAIGWSHAPGRHQYLVAREVLEADLVINLPKLKTHKKAGITAALKNVIGINGHKAYLPHHRKGGHLAGGDNYRGRSRFKRAGEEVLDVMNGFAWPPARRPLEFLVRGLVALAVVGGDDANMDGSWYGNDTVWRTALDLQRVLHFGRPDGSLAPAPARRVLHVTDAIVAGHGEGPLAPEPLPLGAMTLALNAAAAEAVHAAMLGLDPARLPIVRHAFDPHPHALAGFRLEDVRALWNGRLLTLDRIPGPSRPVIPPRGWTGHCERAETTT